MRILAIMRAKEFSPGAVERDEAVMTAVVERLKERGYVVDMVRESDEWTWSDDDYEVVLTMGRQKETLARLSDIGARVINTPEAVARCQRSRLCRIMREAGVPMPPENGTKGYWLKRGDAAGALTADDVVFAADAGELQAYKERFRQRGVDDYVVSAHVEGYEVKFYGVLPTGFFRSFSLSEQQPDEVPGLREAAERLAVAVGIEVYGGDCIVGQDQTFCIIDFNDWPSFARCRDEAAEAVAAIVGSKRNE